jgi:predicted signal transduction protein with EAL and GGDEF domain
MVPAVADFLTEVVADGSADRVLATAKPAPRWFRVHGALAGHEPDRLVVVQLEEATGSELEGPDRSDDVVRDPLTGLYNRRALFDIAELDDPEASQFSSVLMVDVRRFRSINEIWGQTAADHCLVEIARWLRSVALSGDVLIRPGGDHFLVLGVAGSTVARSIEGSSDLTVHFGGHQIFIDLQAGCAERRPGQSLLDVVGQAEQAHSVAKDAPWRKVVAWTPEMTQVAIARVEEEEGVRRAITAGDIEVHFQPLVDLESRRVHGLEALARLTGPGSGIPAERVVSVAHELGLLPRLSEVLFRVAFSDGQRLRRRFGELHIGVNLSREYLGTRLAVRALRDAASVAGFPLDRIVLELTEEMAIGVPTSTLIAELRAGVELGMSVFIDDFGRGETALSTLRRLPLTGIKLDRSLMPADSDEKGWRFVEGIVSLLLTLAPQLVAEGVETALQSERMRRMGVVLQQGYLFGRPAPAEYWLKNLDTWPLLKQPR